MMMRLWWCSNELRTFSTRHGGSLPKLSSRCQRTDQKPLKNLKNWSVASKNGTLERTVCDTEIIRGSILK